MTDPKLRRTSTTVTAMLCVALGFSSAGCGTRSANSRSEAEQGPPTHANQEAAPTRAAIQDDPGRSTTSGTRSPHESSTSPGESTQSVTTSGGGEPVDGAGNGSGPTGDRPSPTIEQEQYNHVLASMYIAGQLPGHQGNGHAASMAVGANVPHPASLFGYDWECEEGAEPGAADVLVTGATDTAGCELLEEWSYTGSGPQLPWAWASTGSEDHAPGYHERVTVEGTFVDDTTGEAFEVSFTTRRAGDTSLQGELSEQGGDQRMLGWRTPITFAGTFADVDLSHFNTATATSSALVNRR